MDTPDLFANENPAAESSGSRPGSSRASMTALIKRIAENGQDFEFYPTTEEIISAVVRDIERNEEENYSHFSSVLDIGAGNGKVLLALRERAKLTDLHAIEKSKILCEQLPADILIIGTDFAEQSLLSKHVDIVFSNPPYSEFEAWAVKIIRQSASSVVYLVIPERWAKSAAIADALRFREAEAITIGEFDFLNAEDRAARAKVHLLRITLSTERHNRRGNDDAFERFFNEEFADLIGKFSPETKTEEEKKERFAELVIGPTYIESLVSLYDAEILNIQKNFDHVSKLDAGLLREFNISPNTIMACLKTRLSGLRSEYWHELFSHLNTVTNRLTSGSRKKLLDVLHKHVHVDFTLSNIYAVMVWVIKNANIYIDSQLIDTYELMVDKCNVILYKSNQRTWTDERWRYRNEPSQNSHYGLDYRIVTHRVGGIRKEWGTVELAEAGRDFLGDLLTLARNLKFQCDTSVQQLSRSGRRQWEAGKLFEFYATDRTGEQITLFDVRAFKNGNLHLRLAKSFILALNVEHGRLKGWLRTREEAAEELKDAKAAEYFNSNQLLSSNPALLLPAPTI